MIADKKWEHAEKVSALPRAMCVVQIDLRFGNEQEGSMAIVVAPVLRFADVGFNADVRLKELGSPDKMIGGFGPELFGSPLQVLKICSSGFVL